MSRVDPDAGYAVSSLSYWVRSALERIWMLVSPRQVFVPFGLCSSVALLVRLIGLGMLMHGQEDLHGPNLGY